MPVNITVTKRTLEFKFRAGTSRGFMDVRDTWFILISDPILDRIGIGECAPLPELSIDPMDNFEQDLKEIVRDFQEHIQNQLAFSKDHGFEIPPQYPSIRFGLEMAWLDFIQGGSRILFSNAFTRGQQKIPINGLVWMASPDQMIKQVDQKIQNGFRCIKMKIGAIDFDQELAVLKHVRKSFPKKDLELRVDANGAFSLEQVEDALDQLSQLDIHSVEQPICAGQFEAMANLCGSSPIPIALDEELIPILTLENKENLLETIKPAYIILKPSLVGGFEACRDWIQLAESREIGWWITSALESNVGLNAIGQFTSTFEPTLYQGLGTGSLFHNNIESPLRESAGHLGYDPDHRWDLDAILG